jgi:DNA-binding SARP family transcriptional activator
MPVLRLELLGDLQIRSAAGTLISVSAKKSQAMLAYLALRPGQLVSRDKMASILWSSTATEQARQSLRQTLSSLRKELASISPDRKLLIEDGDFLGLDTTAVEVDAVEFEALIAETGVDALVRACELYRGDLLDGFELDEEKFDQWVIAERDRLHRLALRTHAHLVELQQKAGDIDGAIATAQHSIRIDPLQEGMHRMLMRLYSDSGDYVTALQQYDACVKILRRELGIEPDAETKALEREVSSQRARRHAAPAAVTEPPRKTVLVVEDNPLNRELTNALLRTAGYEVLLARDGAEALMLLGREEVDLMLLDIDLPFINGHSLLAALKEKGINTPAIFVSGLAGEEPEVRAFEIGAADFIRKPVRNNVLLARIQRVIGDARG